MRRYFFGVTAGVLSLAVAFNPSLVALGSISGPGAGDYATSLTSGAGASANRWISVGVGGLVGSAFGSNGFSSGASTSLDADIYNRSYHGITDNSKRNQLYAAALPAWEASGGSPASLAQALSISVCIAISCWQSDEGSVNLKEAENDLTALFQNYEAPNSGPMNSLQTQTATLFANTFKEFGCNAGCVALFQQAANMPLDSGMSAGQKYMAAFGAGALGITNVISGTGGGGKIITSPVPAGANLVGSDGALGAAAESIKPQPGVFDVVVHGDANGFYVQNADGTWSSISANNLSQYMNATGYGGEAVRLISCGSGAGGATAAQNLANQLGVTVQAPSDTIWIHPGGALTIGPTAGANTGTWNTFTPGVHSP